MPRPCLSPRLAARRGRRLPWLVAAVLALAAVAGNPAAAQPLDGQRTVRLLGRDGASVVLGTVRFTPQADGRSAFALDWRAAAFQDFFLSMKEFKCVQAPVEVFCHVPYPYPQPGTVGPGDLAWLEHSLLFMFKTPSEFGARLWNGIYYRLQADGTALVGTPQAVDLNRISAPPDTPGVPPFRPALRDDIAPGARWFHRLVID